MCCFFLKLEYLSCNIKILSFGLNHCRNLQKREGMKIFVSVNNRLFCVSPCVLDVFRVQPSGRSLLAQNGWCCVLRDCVIHEGYPSRPSYSHHIFGQIKINNLRYGWHDLLALLKHITSLGTEMWLFCFGWKYWLKMLAWNMI